MSPEEYKRRALASRLNIKYEKIHNINHEEIAERLLTIYCEIDPENIWNKEDFKCILYYMIEHHFKEVQ